MLRRLNEDDREVRGGTSDGVEVASTAIRAGGDEGRRVAGSQIGVARGVDVLGHQGSVVVKSTFVPSAEAAEKNTSVGVPLTGPVEMSSTPPALLLNMSCVVSVSAGSMASSVVKKALAPSLDAALKSGMKSPLPAVAEVETSNVWPPARS